MSSHTLSGKIIYHGTGTAAINLIKAGTKKVLAQAIITSDGTYSLENVAPGIYDIQIKKPGYATVTKKNVTADGTQITDINIDITAYAGDVDGDSVIGLKDLTDLLRNFNNSGDSITNPGADLDGDGVVTLEDLTAFLRNFGNGASSGIIIMTIPFRCATRHQKEMKRKSL